MCFIYCWKGKLQNIEDSSSVVLGYQWLHQNMAWSRIIVFGGSCSMADALKVGNFVLTNKYWSKGYRSVSIMF